jgi:hypothetical protein
MINFLIRQTLGPSSARNTLLITVMELYGIPYQIISDPNNITGDAVITDAFVEEVFGNDSEYAKQIIDKCASLGIPIMFYYPSECESTLSSSYYPTRDYVNRRIPIHVVKQGNRPVAGFEEHNLDKYFVYRLLTEFNRARLAYTAMGVDRYTKTFKFLFLNGTTRPNRDEMFQHLQEMDLLKHSLHSYIDYRIPEDMRTGDEIKPKIDWPDANFHEDFRFENFYPPHFWVTEFTLALETAPNELFVTEKTFKPLLVGHPFIAVAGRGHLTHLQNLGFKTYSEFIDESYDDLEYPGERLRAVLGEVNRLCKDDVKIIKHSQQIRNHNRMNMYKLGEEVYYDLYKILINAFPQYESESYVDLPNLTLEQFKKYV